MKRSLLLVLLTLVVLAIPTTASACTWICETAFGPCVYEVNTESECVHHPGYCSMIVCDPGGRRTAMISTTWQIASVEIERRDPADTRESAVRVAANTPAPAKIDSEK